MRAGFGQRTPPGKDRDAGWQPLGDAQVRPTHVQSAGDGQLAECFTPDRQVGVKLRADQIAGQRLCIPCRQREIERQARRQHANSAASAQRASAGLGAELGDAQGVSVALHAGNDVG